MAEVVSCWPLIVEDWVQSQVSLCGNSGVQNENGTRFSPASIIPPMLHTHSSALEAI
jgi:hypothetical protein